MALYPLLTQPVAILTPGVGTNAAGDEIPDWANATTVSTFAFVEAVSGDENEFQRDASEARFKVFLPPNIDIDAGDRISWLGHVMQVVAPPFLRFRPAGLHHVEVHAVEWLG